jgi:undecaprenyl-diphosphatase
MFLNIFFGKIKDADYYLFDKINGDWHSSFFDTFFPFVREPLFWLPLYFFLILLSVVNFKKYGWLWVLILLVNAGLADYISSTIIKGNVMRLRPCRDPLIAEHVRLLVKNCGLNSSFTSSHAVNHFAAAMYIFATFKNVTGKWRWLIFLWAAIPGYAQIYVGVHFPFDILGGAIVGLMLGYIAAYFYNKKIGLVHVEVKRNL